VPAHDIALISAKQGKGNFVDEDDMAFGIRRNDSIPDARQSRSQVMFELLKHN
jgi:hypothetical protein